MKKKLFIFLLFSCLTTVQLVQAQSRKITGTVSSKSDGQPLPGVSVLIKGAKTGVNTDSNGKYTINVSQNDVLTFSFVGFKTLERSIGEATVLNIILSETAEQLNEVKISTGYEKASKRTFTGSVSKITEKELKVEGIVDVSRMIEGKAAGVTVQNVTGTFGTAPKITVRGSSSIFGDTKPLWVIDGVVHEDIVNVSFADLASGNTATLLSSAVAGLNANDVLSIEILKDASSTSIYGSRALNGVVVVTTKQGKRDTPLSVTYSLEETTRTVPNYSQYDILNSQETMSIFKEMEAKGALSLPSTFQGRYGGVYNILARAINDYNVTGGVFGVKNDQQSRNLFLKKYELANTDWFKVLFRPSVTQNHSISIIGGGKNSTYFASLGFYSDPGWTVADNVKRVTSHIKGSFYLNDKLNVTLSTLASVRNQGAPGTYDSKSDNFFGGVARDFDINPFSYVLTTNRTLRPYDDNGNLEYYRNNWAPFNILNELKNNYTDIQVKDIKFQADLEYKINSKLTYNLSTSARYANTIETHNILEKSNVVAAYNAAETTIVRDDNIFLYKDPQNPSIPPVSVLPYGGILQKNTNELTSYNVRNTLSYKNTFREIHELESFVGQEIRYVDRGNDNFTAYGLQYDRGYTAFTDPRVLAKLIGQGDSYFNFGQERERTIGFFGKANYTYNRRFTASLVGRYDGSNQQGISGSSRWLPTYTLSGRWNVNEEKFMKNIDFISLLTLRGGYGLTATAGPATNSLAIYRSFVTNRLNLDNRENGLNISELQNANLTWEKQYETNVGLDLGLFNNRIQFTADAYSRRGFDLVDFVITAGIGGQKIKQGNNANMNTKGLELSLITKNLVNTDLKWTTNFTFSIYKQEITSLQNTPNVFSLVQGLGGNVVGRPRNSLYSIQFNGLNNEGLPTFKLPADVTDKTGGVNFQDTDKITDYLKYEGSVEPNTSAGLSNTFTYQNWSLNLFVVASGGNKVRLAPLFTSKSTDLTVFTKDYINRWINPGDEAITNIPVIPDNRLITNHGINALTKAYNAYNYSDVRIADGSFVRLKTVSLSYEFPKDFKKKLGLATFNLKATTANPWLIYSDKKLNGQDPEFFRSGGVSLPITSQYTFTLNLSL